MNETHELLKRISDKIEKQLQEYKEGSSQAKLGAALAMSEIQRAVMETVLEDAKEKLHGLRAKPEPFECWVCFDDSGNISGAYKVKQNGSMPKQLHMRQVDE